MRHAWVWILLLSLCSQSTLLKASTDVIPEGQLPSDIRLNPLKDLNGYFPFEVPSNPQDWNQRAEEVRRRILISQGLWPMPTKTPINPVIHGRRDLGDYTVEKVTFESFPGFYVTGSLFRPVNSPKPAPAVLSPHGHWSGGRFYDRGEEGVLNDIIQGAERFEEGGRNPIQARSVQLARMGCVVFQYDMIGYADSIQISEAVAHRFATQRPEMNRLQDWGLFSPQAEAHLQSVMGLQSWNSIRALDFLVGLPDVDASRIAVTGASGGGTQTFLLGAMDSRPAVLFPAVMVSTAMQGGCTCENASLLRIDTGNVEFAALSAPRPLGLTSADDWTVEMETKGFPELKRLYGLVGKPDHVSLTALTHFGHNYNYVSRAAMYRWMNRHLKLGLKEPIVEKDFVRLTRDELTVWNESNRPNSPPEFETKLLRHWHDDSTHQIQQHLKKSESALALLEPAFETLVGRTFASAGEIEWHLVHKVQRNGYLEMSGLLKNKTYSEELPATFLYPDQWNQKTVLWIHPQGKGALFQTDGSPIDAANKLLQGGFAVGSVDLLFQGEFLEGQQAIKETRKVDNNREFAGYTLGYNHSLFARRVHDILSLAKFVKHSERQSKAVAIVGLKGAGHWVAAALTQLDGHVEKAIVDSNGFRFGQLLNYRDPDFLPGGAKYLDLPGMLATTTRTPMLLGNATDLESVKTIRSEWTNTTPIASLERKDLTSNSSWIDWLSTSD